ncbi:MAG TPA: hypothetical protein VNW90_03080 [Acetobacteraceae bacterium]|jgi:hypothetical protein|nr:hypothetical protein [Acetobacteraceae bacterium]
MIPIRAMLVAVVLAGCATKPPPTTPIVAEPPETAAAVPTPADPPTANPAPAADAARAYHRAESGEGRAVTKLGATADSITTIHRANALARKAVADLVAQDGHPTKAAIADAKRTLEDLIHALQATPQ